MMKNMYRNDEALTIRLKMPGTGKTVTSAPIHIGQKGGIDSAVISLKHEELPALAAGKTMTLTVESSEDGDAWTELDSPKLVATGGDSNGSGSGEVFMRVPLEAGPWLRLKIAAETSAGDSTAQEAVLAVKV